MAMKHQKVLQKPLQDFMVLPPWVSDRIMEVSSPLTG